MNTSISIQNLCVKNGNKEIFKDFSIDFMESEISVIYGTSGVGKTTLLNCISGLCKPESGTIQFNDLHGQISYLFQEPRLLPWCTLFQNCAIPLYKLLDKKNVDDRVRHFLDKVGLLDRQNDYPENLSGGERQRCAMARAFAFPSNYLLMDEAFQSQDLATKESLVLLLKELLHEKNNKKSKTVIFISHDIRESLILADRVIVFGDSPVQVKLDLKSSSFSKIELKDKILQALKS